MEVIPTSIIKLFVIGVSVIHLMQELLTVVAVRRNKVVEVVVVTADFLIIASWL